MSSQLQEIEDLKTVFAFAKSQGLAVRNIARSYWKKYSLSESILPQAWLLFLVIEVLTLLVLATSYASHTSDTPIDESVEEMIGPWDYGSFVDPTKMALLLETRPQAMLAPLILHFVSVVPPEWKFRFMGSDGSVAYLRSIPTMKRLIDAGKLETTYLPSNVTTNSQETLSAFFTDHWTYDQLLKPAEHLLVFQTDAIMCSNSERSMNEFIKYTWVGAPWVFSEWGGNGGLSLRDVGMLKELLRNETRPPGAKMEDTWLHDLMLTKNVTNLAPRNISKGFSSETIYAYHPMGYHTGGNGAILGGAVWGNPSLRQEVYDWCPEIKMIVDMDAVDFLPGNCSQNW